MSQGLPDLTSWQTVLALALALAVLRLEAIFGRRKHQRLAANRCRLRALSEALAPDGGATTNQVACLLDRDGIQAHEALVRGILSAQRRISIGTYILSHDRVGKGILRLLADRAREGVEVRLLVDAVGSRFLPWIVEARLHKAGGELVRFNPVFTLRGRGSANWRNHRKIAVFDGNVALIGGQNLGGHYIGSNPGRRRFRDASFLIEGPAAASLEHIFLTDWCQATGTEPEVHRAILSELPPEKGEARVSVIDSGPDTAADPLRALLVRELRSATRSIDLVTPYFVPDDELLELLGEKARAGVAVRLILPRRSDHPITDFARRSPLRSLHAAGAKVWLHGPGVLHAKLTLIDGRAALVGSANLDRRSLFLNYEVGALIEDEGVMNELERYIEGLARESRRYDPVRSDRAQRWDERLMERLARLVANQL